MGEASTRGMVPRAGGSFDDRETTESRWPMASNIPKNNRIDAMTADQNLIDGFKEHATAIPAC
jgi:hypothetical protein